MPKLDQGRIRDEIQRQVATRGPGKTICPSEVARALSGDETVWRALMPSVREAAIMLADEGKLVITQKGVAVSGPDLRGPVRLGLPDR